MITKVLYIAGWGRSGSTLLNTLLGQVAGFFAVGELRNVWDHSLLQNAKCGCGLPFADCQIWREIFRRAFGGMEAVDPAEMIRLRESGARSKHIPLLLTPVGRRRTEKRLRAYLDGLERLYGAISVTTGARVIVDSSKFPSYAALLDMLETLDVYLLHLVRDPRAVAHSWQRKKLRRDTDGVAFLHQWGPAASAIRWNSRNAAAEAIRWRSPDRYLRLRYEDLIREPQSSLREILEFVHEPGIAIPVEDDRMLVGPIHSAWGNPDRTRTGPIVLRMDDEWRTEMPRSHRAITTLLTSAMLPRYGYRIRVGR